MYDVIIIGAGAAGLMAAGEAARSGRSVLVVEKMEKAARKVRITGKGRCNLTNIKPAEEFLEKVRTNRDFFRPAFTAFDNERTVKFFRNEGVRIIFERGGRVFPSINKEWDIAEALVDWAVDGGAEIMYNTTATELVIFGGKVRGVKVIMKKGYPRTLESAKVIIATGGVSYPSTGSTGDGYTFAHEAGHRIEEVRPSLVALKSENEIVGRLKGLELRNVRLRMLVDGQEQTNEFGEMSFSDRGVEGPVILRISREAVDALIEEKTVELSIDIKPALDHEVLLARIQRDIDAMLAEARGETEEAETQENKWFSRYSADKQPTIGDLLRKLMPKPMIGPFATYAELAVGDFLLDFGPEKVDELACKLKDIRIGITDYGSFEQAVVTAGGVAVEEVDPRTMQSKLVKGLYFAGEVLDLDADTGGYNLQIAFSTGHVAGKLED